MPTSKTPHKVASAPLSLANEDENGILNVHMKLEHQKKEVTAIECRNRRRGERMIEVYIDGSSKGNPGPGGAGIVIKNAASQEMLSRHGIPLGHVTNNQAEFLALKHALIELQTRDLSEQPIKILTDSQLVVGIFSQNWKARANLELVVEIRDLVKDFPKLTFAYVRGHNGNPGNELADSLAQKAAETQKGNDDPLAKALA